jgi:predicted ester cyclase
VNQDAPDNELLPNDPPAKLIDTFKDTFAEAREGFPDLTIIVENMVADGDRAAARASHARHPPRSVPGDSAHRQTGA